MTSPEINPSQNQLQESEMSVTNWNTVATDSPPEHYESYKFDGSSSEGMIRDETYLNPKGDN